MLVQVTIPVANVSALLAAGYTHVEVWQSTDGGNLYNEITDSAPRAAVLTSLPALTTYFMSGKLLKLRVDGGAEQSISFSTVVPYWTPIQVANRINEVVASLASVVGTSVVLTSPTTGRASTLEITYNDASDLGLGAGTVAVGKAIRIALVPDTFVNIFTDVSGSEDDRYKWRFSANGASPISDFALRVFGSDPPLDPTMVSLGTATFLSVDGRAKQVSLIIVSDAAPTIINGFVVGADQPLVVTADETGFIQVPLIRNATVRIALEGTAFVREIVVPDEDTFDLLTALSTAPDPFTVQSPLPFVIRRSL